MQQYKDHINSGLEKEFYEIYAPLYFVFLNTSKKNNGILGEWLNRLEHDQFWLFCKNDNPIADATMQQYKNHINSSLEKEFYEIYAPLYFVF